MRIASKFGIAFSTFALTLSGMTVAATSAQADPGQCGSRQLCIFENANYSGGVFHVQDRLYVGNKSILCDKLLSDNFYNNGKSVNDSGSSVINNTGNPAFLYTGSWNSGAYVAVPAGRRLSSLQSVTAYDGGVEKQNFNMDNKGSAFC
ncbi:peptidase inhibitor family I36 protein [Micromonospora sp. NPDC007208]|uniref:peptidase inhibitor family I36 protein n=1 Tax=Micromonospora sp. NPDC007208 TaxID=3364236 RepID=UPI0036B47E77